MSHMFSFRVYCAIQKCEVDTIGIRYRMEAGVGAETSPQEQGQISRARED